MDQFQFELVVHKTKIPLWQIGKPNINVLIVLLYNCHVDCSNVAVVPMCPTPACAESESKQTPFVSTGYLWDSRTLPD